MLNYSENKTSDTNVPGAGISPLLSFANVSHVYGSAASPVAALQNVSLDVAPGEFVAVVGASGCGKSTLLRIASGLLKPSAGDAMFAGETIEGPTSQISMIFQDAVMLPWFTVLENVALPEKIARRNLDAARHRARGGPPGSKDLRTSIRTCCREECGSARRLSVPL